jgi:hypothetical protein
MMSDDILDLGVENEALRCKLGEVGVVRCKLSYACTHICVYVNPLS